MKYITLLVLFTILLFDCLRCDEVEEVIESVIKSSQYYRAEIQSCPGCSLNKLTDVKAFIYNDAPKYDRVDFKKIQGAPPELVFFDKEDKEIERVSLKKMSREDCNLELLKRGFLLKLAARTANKEEL
ncbi:hypothetical protein Trydic_g17796 [Trypoxylus dichotomus]